MKFRNGKRITWQICFTILIILFSLWSLFPYLYAIIFSTSGPTLPTKLGLPEKFSIEAYKYVLFEDSILPYFKNTFIIALLTCLITIPVSTIAGYGFSRANIKGFNWLFYALLVFRMIPWVTPVLPTFLLMQKLHLIDTHFGISLAHSLWLIPFAIWLIKSYFDMVPKEFEESAYIDGASNITAFFKIVLPLAIIGVVVSTLLVFLFSYIEFIYALILSRGQATTFPIKIASYSTEGRMYWREMSAAALLSTIPMIALFTFLQKHIAGGLTFGALKE
jgi:multiple sugar transport system permease protein